MPAILLVVPYESIRDRINSGDPSLFEDGTAKKVIGGCATNRRAAIYHRTYFCCSIVIGTFLTPNFFASVFRKFRSLSCPSVCVLAYTIAPVLGYIWAC